MEKRPFKPVMGLLAIQTTPIAMGLLTGGMIAFAMGLFANLYRFYNENREKIINTEDYVMWTGVFMILASIIMTFIG